MESPARRRARQLSTRRSFHYSKEESTKGRTDKVRNPSLAPITIKVGSVFDRLGSQHSLTSQRTPVELNLKCPLEQTEPKLSTLKDVLSIWRPEVKEDGKVPHQALFSLHGGHLY